MSQGREGYLTVAMIICIFVVAAILWWLFLAALK
jgi:hypothetical protein